MAKTGRPPKYSSTQYEELAAKALTIQNATPLLSETALCALLGGSKHLLRDMGKRDERILSLRTQLHAIRQKAWEERGHLLGSDQLSSGQATLYVWMTRNICGWRNDPPPRNYTKKSDGQSHADLTPLIEQLKALVKDPGAKSK